VVVTGLGLVTPVGVGTEASWKAVVAGESGAGPIATIDASGFPVRFACEVKDFTPSDWMDAHESRRVDRFAHFAMASARMALEDSGADMARCDPWRCGCVYASGIGGIRAMEEQYNRYLQKGPSRVSPFTILYLMINASGGNIAIAHGLKGVNYGPVSACSSAAHALGLALRHIQWGEADLMVAGGSEAAISVLGMCGFASMKALSTRNGDPRRASRPFDRERDGFVMGEGGGALVLESLGHAQARGARILAEFCGYAANDDAHHITAPDPEGEGGYRCMAMALADAGLAPDRVDYINAHGTGTLYNDRVETLCIKRALGPEASRRVSVSSTKGQTGHTLGAAGALEAAFTCLALRDQVAPPTINYGTPDPECDLDVTPNQARRRDIRYALSNSLGFGGHNVTLCFGRWPPPDPA